MALRLRGLEYDEALTTLSDILDRQYTDAHDLFRDTRRIKINNLVYITIDINESLMNKIKDKNYNDINMYDIKKEVRRTRDEIEYEMFSKIEEYDKSILKK